MINAPSILKNHVFSTYFLATTIMLIAVFSLCVTSSFGLMHGQPPTICTAANVSGSVGNPSKSWVAGPPPGYRYTWSWSYTYNCTNGLFTNCDVDEAIMVAIWDPAISDYGPPAWEYRCNSNYKPCGDSRMRQNTTTYPPMGTLAPGTIFMIVFSATPHDPTIPNCSDQNFTPIQAQIHSVPPAP